MKPYRVCVLNDVPDPGTRGFCLTVDDREMAIIAVRWHGRLACYLNACPHTGVELNWQADQFFDIDETFLQCAVHGALFRPDDGYCVQGPCVGRSLTRLETTVCDGVLHVRL